MATEAERLSRLEGAYEHLATKADVEGVRTEVERLRADVERVRAEVAGLRGWIVGTSAGVAVVVTVIGLAVRLWG